jgi:hypothetical protein
MWNAEWFKVTTRPAGCDVTQSQSPTNLFMQGQSDDSDSERPSRGTVIFAKEE